MKQFIKKVVNQLGFEIIKAHPIHNISKEIYKRYINFTMIPERFYVDNLKLIWDFKDVQGCIVECGVWRGGMSAGIATLLSDREYFLFDSFEGLPKAKEIDGEGALAWQSNTLSPGYHDNCKAELEYASKAMTLSGAKHKLIKGWFNQTLPLASFNEPIAILRLDADWYDSTMDCLTYLYPRVSKNGIIIFDDYYVWDGCSRAVHEYLSKTSSVSRIYRTQEGTPYLIKKD